MCGTKAAIAAMVLCAPLTPMAMAGDGWRLSLGDGRFGIQVIHREPVVIAPPPPRCEPQVVVIRQPRYEPVRIEPVRIERCEPVYTTLSKDLCIDGRDVRATLTLWKERGEVRSKVTLSALGRALPDLTDASFTLEQGRRASTTDMDPVRDRDDHWSRGRGWERGDRHDRQVVFAADNALCADTGRSFEASITIKTCRGNETVRWCDVRVN